MTANELADLIEDVYPRGFVKDAADLLRQQQAEIEALKNARDYWCLAYKDVFNKLETLKNDSK